MGVYPFDFGFKTPKGTSLHGTTSFDVFFCVTINVAVASLKNKKNEIIGLTELGVIFHAYGEKKTLVRSGQNFAVGEMSWT